MNSTTTPRRVLPVAPVKVLPWGKRTLDLALCVVGFPFLCLGTLVMAGLVRLASPGPVFFRQERVGYKGRLFTCYKFRTMKVNADTRSHQAYLDTLLNSNSKAPMVKLDSKGDSRLIPLGWILRATGLDELPQLINVFAGEMSFVGPRPCLPYEYEKYQSWQRERFDAVPGLTGLWQVSGKNRTTFDEMIGYDISYARRQSVLLDLRIILLTPTALAVQIADIGSARRASSVAPKPVLKLPREATVKQTSQAV